MQYIQNNVLGCKGGEPRIDTAVSPSNLLSIGGINNVWVSEAKERTLSATMGQARE